MKKLLLTLTLLFSFIAVHAQTQTGGTTGRGTVTREGTSRKGERARYAIASLPTCNSGSVDVTVNVSDGNRGQRTCREVSSGVYSWVDDMGGDYNVTNFGVLPSNSASTNNANFAALKAIITGTQAVIVFPSGTFNFSSPSALTLLNEQGITIKGAGKTSTIIVPQSGFTGASVFTLINCRDMTIKDMEIRGDVSNKPLSGIRSRVESPRAVNATSNIFTSLVIGSSTLDSMDYGVLYDYDTSPTACGGGTCDLGNDNHTLKEVSFRNQVYAGVYINQPNSLLNVVDDVKFDNTGGGVKLNGGSVLVSNSSFGVRSTGDNFNFGSGIYYHPSFISNSKSEGTANLLITASDDMEIYFSNFEHGGGTVGQTTVDFQSQGTLSFVNCHVYTGQTGTTFRATHANAHVQLANNVWGIANFTIAGTLKAVNNRNLGGISPDTITITRDAVGVTPIALGVNFTVNDLSGAESLGFFQSSTVRRLRVYNRTSSGTGAEIELRAGASLENIFLIQYAAGDLVLRNQSAGTVYLDGNTGGFRFRSSSFANLLLLSNAGDLTASAGNVLIATAGKTLSLKTGSNACAGWATLSSGSVVVATTCVGTLETDTGLTLTPKGSSTGVLRISATTANTSFTITSTDAASADKVYWQITKLN